MEHMGPLFEQVVEHVAHLIAGAGREHLRPAPADRDEPDEPLGPDHNPRGARTAQRIVARHDHLARI